MTLSNWNIDWLPDLTNDKKIGANQISQWIETAIINKQLVSGDNLPSQRRLAYYLQVNPTTVKRAYQQLMEKRLVAGEIGRGTYVLPESSASLFSRSLGLSSDNSKQLTDLSINRLYVDKKLLSINKQIHDENSYTYRPEQHEYITEPLLESYRIQVCQFLAKHRQIQFNQQQIVVIPSCFYGIRFILENIAKKGDTVLIEQYTSPNISRAIETLGLKVVRCRCDNEGVCPDDLLAKIKQSKAKLLVSIPTFQSPLGSNQSIARRKALAHIIKTQQITVIEDDIYGIYSDKVPPLSHYCFQHSFLVSGFSKVLSGGYRVAFIASQHPIMSQLQLLIHDTAWLVSTQAIAHLITAIERGYIDQAIAYQHQQLQLRNQQLHAIYPTIYSDIDKRPHWWLTLSDKQYQQIVNAGFRLAESAYFNPQQVKAVKTANSDAYRISLLACSSDKFNQFIHCLIK